MPRLFALARTEYAGLYARFSGSGKYHLPTTIPEIPELDSTKSSSTVDRDILAIDSLANISLNRLAGKP